MWSSVMRSACVTRSAELRFVVTPLLAWDSPSISRSRVPTCEAASIAPDKNSDDVFMMPILPEPDDDRLQKYRTPPPLSEAGFCLSSVAQITGQRNRSLSQDSLPRLRPRSPPPVRTVA